MLLCTVVASQVALTERKVQFRLIPLYGRKPFAMHKRASYQRHTRRSCQWWCSNIGTQVVNHVQTPPFHHQQLPSCSQARKASHRQGLTAFFALSASFAPFCCSDLSLLHFPQCISWPPIAAIKIAGAKNVTVTRPKQKRSSRSSSAKPGSSLQNPASVLSHRPTKKHDSRYNKTKTQHQRNRSARPMPRSLFRASS